MLQPIGKPAKSEKRVLAAPFQNSTLEVANVQIKDSNDNVDYRNFKFKQLDKFGNITYDTVRIYINSYANSLLHPIECDNRANYPSFMFLL